MRKNPKPLLTVFLIIYKSQYYFIKKLSYREISFVLKMKIENSKNFLSLKELDKFKSEKIESVLTGYQILANVIKL